MYRLVPDPTGYVIVRRKFDASPFAGGRVRLSAFLRTESVVRRQAVMMLLALNTAPRIEIAGTSAWERHELVMDVPQGARWVLAQVRLQGAGTVWASEVTLAKVDASVPLSEPTGAPREGPSNMGFEK